MQVTWHEHAIVDLERLKEFISHHNKEAALKAARHIRAAVMHISIHPQLGKPVEGFPDYREIVIPFGSSGYVVRYRILSDAVLIIAVKHGREAGFSDQAAKLWIVKDPVEEAYGFLADCGP
jgi:plasmid stabilization system protein ParE